MMKMLLSLARSSRLFLAVFWSVVLLGPAMAQNKAGNDQGQIILLNDSAAALEDSNPDISKRLTEFADEKEKEWEKKDPNADTLPVVLTDKIKAQIQDRIKLLRSASDLIETTYPLIAKALKNMANGMNRAIELEK